MDSIPWKSEQITEYLVKYTGTPLSTEIPKGNPNTSTYNPMNHLDKETQAYTYQDITEDTKIAVSYGS